MIPSQLQLGETQAYVEPEEDHQSSKLDFSKDAYKE